MLKWFFRGKVSIIIDPASENKVVEFGEAPIDVHLLKQREVMDSMYRKMREFGAEKDYSLLPTYMNIKELLSYIEYLELREARFEDGISKARSDLQLLIDGVNV